MGLRAGGPLPGLWGQSEQVTMQDAGPARPGAERGGGVKGQAGLVRRPGLRTNLGLRWVVIVPTMRGD